MVARFYVLVARTSCHENVKFISSSQCVMFFLLYKHTDDSVVDDFPKISYYFAKISEVFPKLFQTPDELA